MRNRSLWVMAGVLTLSFAAALAIVAGAYTAGKSSSSGTQAAATSPASSRQVVAAWPPRPTNIVTISAIRGKEFQLSVWGAATEVYEVPAGQWLVVTDVRASDEDLRLFEIELNGRDRTRLSVKSANGVESVYHSTVGIAFGPGSKVVTTNDTLHFNLTGYLTEP